MQVESCGDSGKRLTKISFTMVGSVEAWFKSSLVIIEEGPGRLW